MKYHPLFLTRFLTVLGLFSIHTSAASEAVDTQKFLYKFEIDRSAGERYMPLDTMESEQKEYQRLIDLFSTHFQEKYGSPAKRAAQKDQGEAGYALRGVHAKGHGCLMGSLTVEDHGQPNYKFGVFKAPQNFDIIVRFSNGDGPPTKDKDRTISMGMAFKVLGVKEPKLLKEQTEEAVDFLMTNHPNFIVGQIQDFVKVIEGREGGVLEKAKAVVVARSGLLQRLQVAKHDPLVTSYWGNLPFKIGQHVVKYLVRPEVCPGEKNLGEVARSKELHGDTDFLAALLTEHITNHDACYGLYLIKKGKDAESPVEDATVAWPEDPDHLVRVGRLFLPVQTPNEELTQMNLSQSEGLTGHQLCQHLSFSPWNTTADFKPLSSLNRARRVIYELSAEMRRHINRAKNPVEAK